MTELVVEGLGFPESPRWRDGRLFFSDMATRAVRAVDASTGALSTVLRRCPGAPSGLAWDEAGRLLVVSMARRCLYRDDGRERLTVFADLTAFAGGWRNDMVRHPSGWCYVGAVGEDESEEKGLAELVMVAPDGSARVVAEGLDGPNGMAITADQSTLIVAEYGASRLTAFSLGDDGLLSDCRTWAELPGVTPDGICIDAEGATWVATAATPEVLRVLEGGIVSTRITASQNVYAPMLGGPDRQTLFLCTAPGADAASRAVQRGCIEQVSVEVPGAGWP